MVIDKTLRADFKNWLVQEAQVNGVSPEQKKKSISSIVSNALSFDVGCQQLYYIKNQTATTNWEDTFATISSTFPGVVKGDRFSAVRYLSLSWHYPQGLPQTVAEGPFRKNTSNKIVTPKPKTIKTTVVKQTISATAIASAPVNFQPSVYHYDPVEMRRAFKSRLGTQERDYLQEGIRFPIRMLQLKSCAGLVPTMSTYFQHQIDTIVFLCTAHRNPDNAAFYSAYEEVLFKDITQVRATVKSAGPVYELQRQGDAHWYTILHRTYTRANGSFREDGVVNLTVPEANFMKLLGNGKDLKPALFAKLTLDHRDSFHSILKSYKNTKGKAMDGLLEVSSIVKDMALKRGVNISKRRFHKDELKTQRSIYTQLAQDLNAQPRIVACLIDEVEFINSQSQLEIMEFSMNSKKGKDKFD
ncbi:hypothetical protein [uncultured Pontibacter sp.]|uniref:hypothetical protein n=1 Tax=uncultured Pontibacter sp. TaxID=453356 RepID=UPI00260AE1A0|nr:hypothetical protein [uncultured Pontibacter sp.]